MKANEIQIGDWVYSTFSKLPCKVTYLKLHESGYASVETTNVVGVKDIESLSPIPITPEILEKNGFEKTQIYGEKQDDIFQCFDGEIIIEVGIYDPNFILIHYRYETPDGINSGELSSIVKVDGGKFYLHELQHALLLCGIEKEIIM